MSNAKPFPFRVPQYREDLNTGSVILVGELKVKAIGYTFNDGDYRSVDIDQIQFYYGNDTFGTDVYQYIKNLQPDIFEQLERQAETLFKEYVTSQKSTPNL